jgi:acetolactate synthase-1/3 small subunit
MVEPATATTLTLLVHDRPGALAKIANLLHRRGVNIRTLRVGPSTAPEQSHMRFELAGPAADYARIALALDNLVDVVSVEVRDATSDAA